MRKGINFEHNLDILVNTLQREIYDRVRTCYEVGKSYNVASRKQAEGISESIEHINQQFNKNYESGINDILIHYANPLQKKTTKVMPSEK